MTPKMRCIRPTRGDHGRLGRKHWRRPKSKAQPVVGAPRPAAASRLVHIRKTVAVERIEVSPECVPRLHPTGDLAVAPEALPFAIDDQEHPLLELS